jgi:hypothetical protein
VPASASEAQPPVAGERLAVDVAIIAGLHVVLAVAVRAAGFDHISDDDFSRVTIAQAFAHAPKIDPSGTSWLPFPFWVLGGLLAIFGRSLEAARALSIVVASSAAALPYLAMRAIGVARTRAIAATILAFVTPWAVWLGATTVPESIAASLTAAAALSIGVPHARQRTLVLGVVCLACACLSRYESWPVAPVLAIAILTRRRDRFAFAIAAACAIGPLAWMLWNAHAHDGALHFFRRVASYKRAIGEGTTDTWSAAWLYPRLFVTTRPEIAFAVAALLPDIRRWARRWGFVLLAALAQIAFLSYGNIRDGAPAHHPERALFAVFVLLAMFVAAEESRRVARCIVLGLALFTWARDGRNAPGKSAAEDRSEAVAKGRALRDAPHLVVTPCAYEHFATIAAYGAPERVTVLERQPSDTCPTVGVP